MGETHVGFAHDVSWSLNIFNIQVYHDLVPHCRYLLHFLFLTDDLYTPEATARPIDLGVKRPPEYIDTWQKPVSGKVKKSKQ